MFMLIYEWLYAQMFITCKSCIYRGKKRTLNPLGLGCVPPGVGTLILRKSNKFFTHTEKYPKYVYL